MSIETFRWLAGVIAAHPDSKVVGRTRLQKTIRLLQRIGLPTEYPYKLFFDGPYSDGLRSGVAVLESLQLAEEEECLGHDGTPFFVVKAKPDARLPQIAKYQPVIDRLANEQPVILELAAAYDVFRELGSDHKLALERLRRKKGEKCAAGRESQALELLGAIGLQNC